MAKQRKPKLPMTQMKPPDEAVALALLGGLFCTVVAAIVSKSLLVLVGGVALTVAVVKYAVGDAPETKGDSGRT
jgi:hypothetical protein